LVIRPAAQGVCGAAGDCPRPGGERFRTVAIPPGMPSPGRGAGPGRRHQVDAGRFSRLATGPLIPYRPGPLGSVAVTAAPILGIEPVRLPASWRAYQTRHFPPGGRLHRWRPALGASAFASLALGLARLSGAPLCQPDVGRFALGCKGLRASFWRSFYWSRQSAMRAAGVEPAAAPAATSLPPQPPRRRSPAACRGLARPPRGL
jgi:hypothetical protein